MSPYTSKKRRHYFDVLRAAHMDDVSDPLACEPTRSLAKSNPLIT